MGGTQPAEPGVHSLAQPRIYTADENLDSSGMIVYAAWTIDDSVAKFRKLRFMEGKTDEEMRAIILDSWVRMAMNTQQLMNKHPYARKPWP
jgi:hypothetical protein